MSRAGFEANEIEDLRGFESSQSMVGVYDVILMFSMAGVPPLVGFIAKLSILNAMIDVNLTWVAVVATVFSRWWMRIIIFVSLK